MRHGAAFVILLALAGCTSTSEPNDAANAVASTAAGGTESSFVTEPTTTLPPDDTVAAVPVVLDVREGRTWSTDIATTQAELDLFTAEWALDPIELEPGSAVLSFVLAESSTPECAIGEFIGLRFDDRVSTVFPVFGPRPYELFESDDDIACNSDANSSGYLLLVQIDDLPPNDFRLDLEPSFTPTSAATLVDQDRRSDDPFGGLSVLEPGVGLEIGDSGVALRLPTDCGPELLWFDVDGVLWASDYGPAWEAATGIRGFPSSWESSITGSNRIDVVLRRTSLTMIEATPTRGGEPLTYQRLDNEQLEECG